jgi:glucosamine--fructose-6-phosphate aminotransferase (isomerizing)
MNDLFLSEIQAQPETLVASAASLGGQVEALHELSLLKAGSTHIVLTGMGSSHDACLAAASVLGACGVLATTVNTAELIHFRLPSLTSDTLLIAISQSGRSAELVRLATELAGKASRPRLVSVTNGLSNPLAEAADIAFDIAAGEEFGPSTKTFAATCLTLAAITRILAGGEPESTLTAVKESAAVAAGASRALLTEPPETQTLTDWLGDRTSAVIVGRGTARGAAEMAALVLKEAAGFSTECLDGGEFRHGPLELAGPRLAVAVIATEPRTHDLDLRLANEVATHGAAVLLVTSEDGEPIHPGVRTIQVGRVDRMLVPAVGVIPFQLLAWRLAVLQGRDPGRFTNAAKVTTTE